MNKELYGMNKEKQVKSTDWLATRYSEEEIAKMKAEAIKEAEAELREKQIEELTNELVFTSNYGTYNAVANYLVNKGYRKQSKGEWIWDKEHSNYKCSLCGEYDISVPKFCRECGAKMKGGEEE